MPSLRDELALGRQELTARSGKSMPRTIQAGELLADATGSRDAIHHLIAGWACQRGDFSDDPRAIVDIYVPGDVIGLDAVLQTRPLENVLTLTSIALAPIGALTDLMTCRSTALYIAWLLGQRQRRADRLLAAISRLEARERLATMVLDFYTRLSRQRLVTGSAYSLPLTQPQIGAYLGLTVPHVNRVLRSLRDERIVAVERHSVTILNFERLARLAQDGRVAPAAAAVEFPVDVVPLERGNPGCDVSA